MCWALQDSLPTPWQALLQGASWGANQDRDLSSAQYSGDGQQLPATKGPGGAGELGLYEDFSSRLGAPRPNQSRHSGRVEARGNSLANPFELLSHHQLIEFMERL